MAKKKNDQPVKNQDKQRSKLSNKDAPEHVSLCEFLDTPEIKLSDFVKSRSFYKHKFDEEIINISISKFNFKNSFYVDRLLELVPKHIDRNDRVLGNKIISAIYGRHALKTEGESLLSIKTANEFFSEQKKYLADKYRILKSNIDYRNVEKNEVENTKKAIIFEFKLTRLLLHFICNQPWFTAEYFLNVILKFHQHKALGNDYSFTNGISGLFQVQKSSVQLVAVANSIGMLIDQAKSEAKDQRIINERMQYELNEKSKIISEQKQLYHEMDNEITKLTVLLSEQRAGRESDRRISSVGQSEIKARTHKAISSLMRDEITLITEMLSDGDEFNSRVLQQVDSIKQKLEDLKSWTSSLD